MIPLLDQLFPTDLCKYLLLIDSFRYRGIQLVLVFRVVQAGQLCDTFR
jgi:hypothetical protein